MRRQFTAEDAERCEKILDHCPWCAAPTYEIVTDGTRVTLDYDDLGFVAWERLHSCYGSKRYAEFLHAPLEPEPAPESEQ